MHGTPAAAGREPPPHDNEWVGYYGSKRRIVFVVIFSWTAIWLGWNLLAPRALQFDPPMAFAFWLFLSNVLQMLLMPLIMVGQNIQGRRAETRAENDLQVNITAEREIEVILRRLEYQNSILIAMPETLGGNLDEVLRKRGV
jgi:uncharacterized membrane protein